MSTSSLYSPEEEDEEASDIGDLEPKTLHTTFPVSSPRLQELALSSPVKNSEPLSRSQSRASKRIRLRSRTNAWRALRKLPIGGYRELCAETCDDVLQGSTYYIGDNLPATQNGATTWTSLEKDRFFNALARVGKTRCQDIAVAVESKSEMEVRDYIQLLHRGLEYQHTVEEHTGTTILGDFPAALEVSEECCEALDQASEVVSMEEQRSDRLAAKKRHGNMSLIDRDMADVVEENLETETDEKQNISEIDIAAGLFKFRNWIKTSERLFMNFGEPRSEDNWENVKFEDESPSLTSDAFLDFHSLAISVTRRLVQSSIFFAMSRIRALESGSSHPLKTVRSRDVTAALDVLRMKHNADEFWAGVARRCSLNVIDLRNDKGWKPVFLNHDEVEEKLSGCSPSSSMSHLRADSPLPSGQLRDTTEYSDSTSDGSSVRESNSPSPASPSSSDEDLSDPEEAHASALDKQASSLEEARLWQILQASSTRSPDPDEKKGKIKLDLAAPHGQRKAKQDLVDWRNRIRYRSEWEEFGHDTLTLEEEFAEDRRKRRKTGSQPRSEGNISGVEMDLRVGSDGASDEDLKSTGDRIADENIYSDRMDVDTSSEDDAGFSSHHDNSS